MEFPSRNGIPSTRNSVDTEFRRHGIPSTRNSVDTEFRRHGIPSTLNSVDTELHRYGIPSTWNSVDTEFRIQKYAEFRGITQILLASLYIGTICKNLSILSINLSG